MQPRSTADLLHFPDWKPYLSVCAPAAVKSSDLRFRNLRVGHRSESAVADFASQFPVRAPRATRLNASLPGRGRDTGAAASREPHDAGALLTTGDASGSRGVVARFRGRMPRAAGAANLNVDTQLASGIRVDVELHAQAAGRHRAAAAERIRQTVREIERATAATPC